jgi:Na+/H+-translocating membrane pyrophosphatase
MATIFNNCLWASGGQDGFPCNASGIEAVSLSIAGGGIALIAVVCLVMKLKRSPRGTFAMNSISDRIRSGAIAFLRTEYRYLGWYVFAFFLLILVLNTMEPPSGNKLDGVRYASSFLAGAVLSAAAGWTGMLVATDANVRTTQAADKHGLAVALRVAFTGGSVMGFTVVGSGLLGLSIMFVLVSLGYGDVNTTTRFIFSGETLSGFGFGASSIALFARVAGGIFTISVLTSLEK